MSRFALTRTGNEGYRAYLDSEAWAERRQRWFDDCRAAGFEPACQVCSVTLTAHGSLDLHHVDYDGVSQDTETGEWSAQERHKDLLPMCRACHMELHRRMDTPRAYYGWSRRRATVHIAARMRKELSRKEAG